MVLFLSGQRPADVLRIARATHGYSQASLGKLLAVHPSLVSAWETGRSTPNEETRNRIAFILGIDDPFSKGSR